MKQILILLFITLSVVCLAQTTDNVYAYRKASIYSVMLGHTTLPFNTDIENAFKEMPTPTKYNDHNLSKRVFYANDDKVKITGLDKHGGFVVNGSSDKSQMNEMDLFLQKTAIASRMLAKWFNKDTNTGVCNMKTILERGCANASEFDKKIANLSMRRDALLMDAGEELVGSTFVLINDIRYIDKGVVASLVGDAASTAINVYNAVKNNEDTFDQTNIGDIVATYKGFNVKINTYLYQLVWDDEAQGIFYNEVYTETPDDSKKSYFEKHRGDFSLVYVGKQESSGKDVSFIGINDNEPKVMVLKACQRAFDENIANLQKNFEAFKIKSPLLSTEPLTCEIGLKEGVTPDSKFEVLEVIEDEKGHIEYKRKGTIKPVKDKIWDNRFMAKEEGAENADLGFTTFTKVSGGGFYPGMLVREIK